MPTTVLPAQTEGKILIINVYIFLRLTAVNGSERNSFKKKVDVFAMITENKTGRVR